MRSLDALKLSDRLDGQLLTPGDPGYDEGRTVWNARVDRRPRIIVRCASVSDVVTAVRAARDVDLEIGVRCGGHSVLGLAVPQDGLMIDLTLMASVEVQPAQRLARVQGGALLRALDSAAQQHGLATTAGNVSHTGVGGLTLGGGMGWLARQFGLACDNVRSFELVTADGSVLRASHEENPDLYWGLRGGGGNFGVVTEFEFELHPIDGRALVAEFSFPLEEGRQVLRGWRDLNVQAAREATFTAALGADDFLKAGFVWVGDPEKGRRLLPSMRALARPADERVFEVSYVDLQRKDDVDRRHALRRYSKGHYLGQFSDAAIDAFLHRGALNSQSRDLPNVGLQAYGGAIADVADGETAFSHRDTLFEWGVATSWADPAEDQARLAMARRAAAALEPLANGVYVNALSDEGDAGVRRAYSAEKLARLTALKNVYDPDNVFHLNQNIRPTRSPLASDRHPRR